MEKVKKVCEGQTLGAREYLCQRGGTAAVTVRLDSGNRGHVIIEVWTRTDLIDSLVKKLSIYELDIIAYKG